jgi:PqqD family protein of HPr-rel-A system
MNVAKLKELMINDEGFAFDPRTGNTYTMNPTGLLIVNAVKAGANVDQVLDSVAARYEVDRQTADRDLEVFFNELQRNKLIEMEVAS